MKDSSLTLGEKIRFLRERKNLKQKELAEILQIAQQTLSHYEKGRLRPDIDLCKKIALFFGITLDELLASDDEIPSIPLKDNSNTTEIHEASPKYSVTTIAAHNDLDPLADLSPEARKSVEDYIEYARKKYPKKEDK